MVSWFTFLIPFLLVTYLFGTIKYSLTSRCIKAIILSIYLGISLFLNIYLNFVNPLLYEKLYTSTFFSVTYECFLGGIIYTTITIPAIFVFLAFTSSNNYYRKLSQISSILGVILAVIFLIYSF